MERIIKEEAMFVPEFMKQEILNEERLFVDNDKNMCISLDGSGTTENNFVEDPYIKIYRTIKPNRSTKAIRVSVSSDNGPKYIIHNGEAGTLSTAERKWLDDVMKNCLSNGDKKYKGKEMWDAVKKAIKDKSTNISKEQKEKVDNMKCPDFTDIKPADRGPKRK